MVGGINEGIAKADMIAKEFQLRRNGRSFPFVGVKLRI